jgi:hypothetical protein
MTEISDGATKSGLTVRPVTLSEVPQVIDFLRAEFVSHIPANKLMGLFNCSWRSGGEKTTLGFALWSGKESLGYSAALKQSGVSNAKSCLTCYCYAERPESNKGFVMSSAIRRNKSVAF